MTTYPLNKTADNLISRNLKNELCKLSSENVIKVKTRKNGITSGERQRCYWNANLCAQSFAGKPVYGWWIIPPGVDTPGVTKLVGHGCWMNPEGVVVNTTMCDYDEILFLPSTTILQLNTLSVQQIPDLYFLESGFSLDILHGFIAQDSSNNIPVQVFSKELFWGCDSENDFPLNKVFLPRFFLKEQVTKMKRFLITDNSLPDPLVVQYLFSPDIETRPEKMQVNSRRPGFSFSSLCESSSRVSSKMLKYFADTQTHTKSIVHRDYNRIDAVDTLNGAKFYLINPSSHSGQMIHEISPCRSLLDQMKPKGNRKKMRKYETLANQNNLTIQELLLMNDPRYIPHPYLIHKSKKLVRI
jgi:hypothetical protein